MKNRRMEINFDPDEGPFTVDKIAEYDWPLDRKGDTSMVQEQISQYLGVKSFKRKYPDLKRRMVDMEERNFLRENGLVSESLCDMGNLLLFFFNLSTNLRNVLLLIKIVFFSSFFSRRTDCGVQFRSS